MEYERFIDAIIVKIRKNQMKTKWFLYSLTKKDDKRKRKRAAKRRRKRAAERRKKEDREWVKQWREEQKSKTLTSYRITLTKEIK